MVSSKARAFNTGKSPSSTILRPLNSKPFTLIILSSRMLYEDHCLRKLPMFSMTSCTDHVKINSHYHITIDSYSYPSKIGNSNCHFSNRSICISIRYWNQHFGDISHVTKSVYSKVSISYYINYSHLKNVYRK